LLPALQNSLPPPYSGYKISRSRQQVPPKHRQQFTKTHGTTGQKAVISTILFNDHYKNNNDNTSSLQRQPFHWSDGLLVKGLID
jgi:hypothetical protein